MMEIGAGGQSYLKIETYKYYSRVYDLFDVIFPQNTQFVLQILGLISENDLIGEMGGGTGSSTRKLLGLFPKVRMTFIEPSPEMMAIAKKRLSELPTRIDFLEKTVDQALPMLEPHDLFIFQRSLYSFYSDINQYEHLARRLYDKTAPGGHIAIYELAEKYDIGQMRDYIPAARAQSELSEAEFEKAVELFLSVLQEFNEAVDRKIYTLFKPEQLVSIFTAAGFTLVNQAGTSYFFNKQGTLLS
jgi:trans-aconitate methyltransferase